MAMVETIIVRAVYKTIGSIKGFFSIFQPIISNFLFKEYKRLRISNHYFILVCVLCTVILICTSAQPLLLHKVICRLHVSTNK